MSHPLPSNLYQHLLQSHHQSVQMTGCQTTRVIQQKSVVLQQATDSAITCTYKQSKLPKSTLEFILIEAKKSSVVKATNRSSTFNLTTADDDDNDDGIIEEPKEEVYLNLIKPHKAT